MSNAHSQITSFPDPLRNILSQIDLNDVETNYFINQVPDYLPLELFDGTYFTDSVFMHNGRFLLASWIISISHINIDTTKAQNSNPKVNGTSIVWPVIVSSKPQWNPWN